MAIPESGVQGGRHISDDRDFAGYDGGHAAPDLLGGFRTPRTCRPYHRARNLRRRHPGRRAGFGHALPEREARRFLAHAIQVAGAGFSTAKNLPLVPEQTGSLGATAVNAEKVGHGKVLPQGRTWLFWQFGSRHRDPSGGTQLRPPHATTMRYTAVSCFSESA